jgi:mannose-6-phosphate isomerase
MSEVEKLEPFRIEPAFVERIWGSRDLRPWYAFEAKGDPVGEVWLTGDQCRAGTGLLQGKTVGEIFTGHSGAMLGGGAPKWAAGQSPLLMKVIFAKEKLSVQLHPDDRLAQKYGQPRGKTECWYALEADAGAAVAAGLKSGVTLEQVEAGVKDGTLEESLEVVPVEAGDLIFVDAGTVHAIWPGSVLLETQQNSDITYRLYDYGRPRELHVAKAIEAIRLETDAGKVTPKELGDRTVLIDGAYFRVEKVTVEGALTDEKLAGTDGMERLTYLFAAEGDGAIRPREAGAFEAVELPKCGIVALPALSLPWEVVAGPGGLAVIRVVTKFPEAGLTGATA